MSEFQPVRGTSAATRAFDAGDLPLEGGGVLRQVRVAYRTWGRLDATGGNAVIVCHALTGSADADAWWPRMFGPGRALDPDRDFIVCSNVLGSCYGTTGPSDPDPATGRPYGPDFPAVTIRDLVALQVRLADHLGIRSVRTVIGGSLGGMQVLEWPFLAPGRVRSIVPIAASGRHSAWCIGLSECQRQAIFADPRWRDGRYPPDAPPAAGLSVARMIAMCTYRSRESLDLRHGRNSVTVTKTPDRGVASPAGIASETRNSPGLQGFARDGASGEPAVGGEKVTVTEFAVESYLRHQGRKLVDRFDARSYVTLTRAMDSHDLARGRGAYGEVLASLDVPALVVTIPTDVLYWPEEQRELADGLPRGELAVLESPHGHDAFLIEVDDLSAQVRAFRDRVERT